MVKAPPNLEASATDAHPARQRRAISPRRIAAGAYLLLSASAAIYGLALAGWLTRFPLVFLWSAIGYQVWAVASLLVIFHAAGRVTMGIIGGWPPSLRLTLALFQTALGSAVTATAFFLLALSGLFSAWAVVAWAALALGANAWMTWRAAPQANRDKRVPQGSSELAAGSILLLWSAPFVVQVLLPITDHDSVSYHLPMAETLIKQGLWHTDPEFIADNYPAAGHLFYAGLKLVGAAFAGQIFNFVISCGIPLAVYAMGREFWSRRVAWLAVLICLSVNVIWEVGITLRIDSMLAFYWVMATFAFVKWRQWPAHWGCVPMVGAMLGMALNIKYSAVLLFALLIPTMILAACFDRWRRRIPQAGALALALLFTTVPAGFWYVRNAVELEDPIYPLGQPDKLYRDQQGRLQNYYRGLTQLIRQGPALWQVESGLQNSRFSFLVDQSYDAYASEPAHSLNLWDARRRPWLYARNPLHSATPLLLIGLVLPLLLTLFQQRVSPFAGRYDGPDERPGHASPDGGIPMHSAASPEAAPGTAGAMALWTWLFAAATFLMLASQTPLIRYVIPAFPLLALCASLALWRFDDWAIRPRAWWPYAVIIVSGLITISLILTSVAEWNKLLERRPGDYFLGRTRAGLWVARAKSIEHDPFPQFALWLSARQARGETEELGHVLMVAESRGYLLNATYVPDMSWDANRWCSELLRAKGDLNQVARNLREKGFTHIVVNVHFLQHWSVYRLDSDGRRLLGWGLFMLDEFLRNYTSVVEERSQILVLRIEEHARPMAVNVPDDNASQPPAENGSAGEVGANSLENAPQPRKYPKLEDL